MTQDGQLFAVFNSAHRVMKAENILKKSGLAILLIPAPRALSTDCGLAIRFGSDILEHVQQILGSEKTPASIIYRKENSHYEIIWKDEHSAP